MEQMPTLSQLFLNNTSEVSDKWESYLDVYNEIFTPFRSAKSSILEIGIQNGGSLRMWSEYFRDYQIIVGCDVDNQCSKIFFDKPRIEIIIGNALNSATKKKIIDVCENYDVIIEDGSHVSEEIIGTFLQYFSLVKPGGIYVAEDLHTCYWASHDGGLDKPDSAIVFFKDLVDVLNFEHWGTSHPAKYAVSKFLTEQNDLEIESLLRSIKSIKFHNSLVMVEKKRENESLGKRIVTGTKKVVEDFPESLNGTYSLAPDQSKNFWSRSNIRNKNYSPHKLKILIKSNILTESIKKSFLNYLGRLRR